MERQSDKRCVFVCLYPVARELQRESQNTIKQDRTEPEQNRLNGANTKQDRTKQTKLAGSGLIFSTKSLRRLERKREREKKRKRESVKRKYIFSGDRKRNKSKIKNEKTRRKHRERRRKQRQTP